MGRRGSLPAAAGLTSVVGIHLSLKPLPLDVSVWHKQEEIIMKYLVSDYTDEMRKFSMDLGKGFAFSKYLENILNSWEVYQEMIKNLFVCSFFSVNDVKGNRKNLIFMIYIFQLIWFVHYSECTNFLIIILILMFCVTGGGVT